MLNALDLFSGIGGISQALDPWCRTVAYCEQDRFAQAVLLSRMARGEIDQAPIWDDVTTLDAGQLPPIDIICGGFPCQDISVAGKGEGLGGERSGLFFEICRLVGDLRPSFIFLENVSAITIRGGATVIGALAALGYECRWITLSAADVGATHKRERWWCLAYRNEQRRDEARGESSQPRERHPLRDSSSSSLVHAQGVRLQGGGPGGGEGAQLPDGEGLLGRDSNGMGDTAAQGLQKPRQTGKREPGTEDQSGLFNRFELPSRPPKPGDPAWAEIARRWPEVKPALCGVASRIPNRNDRIRSLGNSVDVVCAREAFKILLGIK